MSKLIVMVGESGSGKSTRAKEMLLEAQKNGQNLIRVNRDSIRTMLFGADSSWDFRLKRENEKLVKTVEKDTASKALMCGFSVIVDDINISLKTQKSWEQFLYQWNKDQIEFEVIRMDTPFEECVRRDNLRTGREHVGRAVIERQFLSSGRANFNVEKNAI